MFQEFSLASEGAETYAANGLEELLKMAAQLKRPEDRLSSGFSWLLRGGSSCRKPLLLCGGGCAR